MLVDNITKILQKIATSNTSSSNSYLGGTTPFKVQGNFDIPIFKGQIDANVVDKWLNQLEG